MESNTAIAALMACRPGDQLPGLEELLVRPEWHRDAACRGLGAAAFYPERGDDVRPVKAICAGCPVVDQCAEAGALEVHGIWGGLSGRDRRKTRAEGLVA